MEMFKKYMPHISLGAGLIVLISLFLPAISIRLAGNIDHQFLGMFVAFGSHTAVYKFDMNIVLLIAYLLPVIAGILHFFTQDLPNKSVYHIISIVLFMISGGLFFASPLLFETLTGDVFIENISSTYFANYGFGVILAGVFSLLTALTSIMTLLIVEE